MIFLHEFESFESKNYQTEPGWKSCITLCRSWPTFRRCLRWMTISLTTRLEASGGKCVCMCVSVCVLHHSRWVQDGSVITGTALCLFSDAHAVKHTKTLVHAPMRAVLRLLRPETDTMSCAVCKISANLCLEIQTKQFLGSAINPPRVPGAKHD